MFGYIVWHLRIINSKLWTHPRLTGVEGSPIEVLGKVEVPIAIDNHVLNVSVAVVRGISESAIL